MRDWLGIACSGLCIIHCLALPLALTLGLPVAGLALLTGEASHLIFGVLIVLLAFWAFPPGWRRHKSTLPLIIAGVGVVLMLLAIMGPESLEAHLAVVAGLSLISAHLSNWYLLNRRSQTCNHGYR